MSTNTTHSSVEHSCYSYVFEEVDCARPEMCEQFVMDRNWPENLELTASLMYVKKIGPSMPREEPPRSLQMANRKLRPPIAIVERARFPPLRFLDRGHIVRGVRWALRLPVRRNSR